MNLEDKPFAKVFALQSLSSSVQSTPEKNGHSDDASRSPEFLQEFLKSGTKKELLRTCLEKEKRNLSSYKSKMMEPRSINRAPKCLEPRKTLPTLNCQSASKKQPRKGENPTRLTSVTDQSDYGSFSLICKNSACRATLSTDDTFCKRCSCCICHLFDDNKDPSLWLVCSSDCGLSCHIECALQREKAGVVDLGQLMQLDGSYCCACCGKVSGILSCWKKQLIIAKDARRVDVLCYRILLSYRLLDGTSRFKNLHEIVHEAKSKLETEVGPVDGVSAKMARGIVSRLSVAGDVQKLCSLAIEKVDEWLSCISDAVPDCREGSLPAACKFIFEEVTSSYVTIILIELNTSNSNIMGYKLWYFKSREERHEKEPVSVFPRTQRRILISNLKPCTEYTFRIISYTEDGDLGHSEAKCFTKSVEIMIPRNFSLAACVNRKETSSSVKEEDPNGSSTGGFKVRELGKILQFTWAQEQGCLDGFCSADIEKCCGMNKAIKDGTLENPLPDLNEELTPPLDSSRDEDNGCTLELAVEADDDAVSHETEKNPLKRGLSINEEIHDCDSTLINGSGSPFHASDCSGSLDENFEYCVKIIRLLECEGHIKQEFRLKLLTWFSLRSTEQERRVVHTFIETLIDDLGSLAGQLVDSFSDVVSGKKARNGFCSKLWH